MVTKKVRFSHLSRNFLLNTLIVYVINIVIRFCKCCSVYKQFCFNIKSIIFSKMINVPFTVYLMLGDKTWNLVDQPFFKVQIII